MIGDELAEVVGEICDEGVLATAGQLYAWWGDEAIEVVAGEHLDGRPVAPSDVAEVFCLTKPVVAAAALLALERFGVDLDVPVDELLGGAVALGPGVTVPAIVNHDARLLRPPGIAWMLTAPERRPPLAEIATQPGPGRCYSEVSGWRLLAAVTEALTGTAAARWIEDVVLGPLGLAGEVVLDAASLEGALATGRVLHPVGGLPVDEIPMLHAYAPGYQHRIGPELVGFASARAVGRVSEQLADVLGGVERHGLPASATLRAVVERAGPSAFDRTWQRETRFELGHERLPDGGRAWSLTAYLAPALLVVDAERGAGACLVLNGATTDPADLAACRRRLLHLLVGVAVP